MKLYFRLLSYCRPLGSFVVPYAIFTLLSILFGLLNFTLIVPLLNVIFENVSASKINEMLVMPEFSFSTDYIVKLFNYYFAESIVKHGKFAALQYVCGVIIISFLLSNLFKYLSQRMIEYLKMRTIRNLRNTCFEKITSLDLGYFSNNRKGDIMGRIASDVGEVESSVTSTLAIIFKEPLTLIAYYTLLMILSYKLTIFTLLVIPVSGFLISFILKRLKKEAKAASESLGRLFGIIDETLMGMRIIKGFNAEKFTIEKFKEENNHYTHTNRKMAMRRELASPFSEFTGVVVVSFILLYGGSLALGKNPEIEPATLIAYLALYSQVLRPAKSISTSLTAVNRGLAAGERVMALIDTPVEVVEKNNPAIIKDFKHRIEFKDVQFSYGTKPILKGINFTIPSGKMIALVGPSGGGKSTIADLIPRFFDPSHGEILFDGVPLKDCSIASIRDQIGLVSQESILFNDTIANNIAFGKTNIPEEEIIRAAKIANAHEFIINTENGYHTTIGDRGVRLSGGQKQRLSIARAILKNPPILILDEATSALDTESEKLVQEALNNLMTDRTSLVIAHRLSTIQKADEILVIQDGEIVERGSHSKLLELDKGLYQKLNLMQTSAF